MRSLASFIIVPSVSTLVPNPEPRPVYVAVSRGEPKVGGHTADKKGSSG